MTKFIMFPEYDEDNKMISPELSIINRLSNTTKEDDKDYLDISRSHAGGHTGSMSFGNALHRLSALGRYRPYDWSPDLLNDLSHSVKNETYDWISLIHILYNAVLIKANTTDPIQGPYVKDVRRVQYQDFLNPIKFSMKTTVALNPLLAFKVSVRNLIESDESYLEPYRGFVNILGSVSDFIDNDTARQQEFMQIFAMPELGLSPDKFEFNTN